MRRLLLTACVLAAAAGGAGFLATRYYAAPGPLPQATAIVIPRGGLEAAAQALRAHGAITSTRAFEIAATLTAPEGPVHAGELSFPQGASLRTVLRVLRSGKVIRHRLTFAEGLTAAQIAQILARADALSGDLPVPAEGAVLPETYMFERDSAPAALIGQAESAMQRNLAAEWAHRAPDTGLGTPREALILASVVEREAHLPAERPMIARVFLNRLAQHMRLQADPTAAYVAGGGLGKLDRPLEHADLELASDYNTYTAPGLPPAPICSPGLAAIHAVLHPASGDALYFVADGTGGHLFTNSLTAHDANIAHLRAVRPR